MAIAAPCPTSSAGRPACGGRCWPTWRRRGELGQGRAAVHEASLRRVDAWPEGSEKRPAGRRAGSSSSASVDAAPVAGGAGRAGSERDPGADVRPQPCEHYWADIVADKELSARHPLAPAAAGAGATTEIPTRTCTSSPTRCWPPGASRRDFIGLLDEHDSDTARAGYLQHFADIRQRIDLFVPHGGRPCSTSCRTTSATCARSARPGPMAAGGPGDDSIRLPHRPQRPARGRGAARPAARRLQRRPDAAPRDVIVMVPDIDAYARRTSRRCSA